MTAFFSNSPKLKPVENYLIGADPSRVSGQVPASQGLNAIAAIFDAQGFGREVKE